MRESFRRGNSDEGVGNGVVAWKQLAYKARQAIESDVYRSEGWKEGSKQDCMKGEDR